MKIHALITCLSMRFVSSLLRILATAIVVVLLLRAPSGLSSAEPKVKWSAQSPEVVASRVRAKANLSAHADTTNATELDVLSGGPKPNWIWGGDKDTSYYLSKRFYLAGKVKKGLAQAALVAACDNRMALVINGKHVAEGQSWKTPLRRDVMEYLKPGFNEILLHATNDDGGPAGFVLKLALVVPDKKTQYIVSDKSWQAATKKDAKEWDGVRTVGQLGVAPWRNVFRVDPSTQNADGARGVFVVPPDFHVERLYAVPQRLQSSWTSITFDNKGRLIASGPGDGGVHRITPPPIGDRNAKTEVEPLTIKIASGENEGEPLMSAQGMLYAFDSLYLIVSSKLGSTLYRARDTNGDGHYDQVVELKTFQGSSEQTPKAMRLSSDGKSLYVIAGSGTQPSAGFNSSRVPGSESADRLLSQSLDDQERSPDFLARGGWVAKTDADTKAWKMFSAGFHSPCDIAFNADGEMFACDAEAEPDMVMPSYRPAQVVHATSGSEFGGRHGTGTWPACDVDSQPPLKTIGPGSPGGIVFGYGAKFPAKYQKAVYVLDGAAGTIWALHIEPDGASYKAAKEEFVSRTPLPLADAEVGPDGAIYFTIGGGNTASELYRLTYVGKESTKPASAMDTRFADMRALRRKLEAYHWPVEDSQAAVDLGLKNLGHADRHIRYAARVALEHQPLKLWEKKVLAEENPQALIGAVVALSRQGIKQDGSKLLAALNRLDLGKLSESQQLDLLRAYALVFNRQGRPGRQATARLIDKLDPFYPAKSYPLNRELSRVLADLNSPTVISKTLALMIADQATNQNVHYAYVLGALRNGWTLEQRRSYFKWLDEAGRNSGEMRYQVLIANIRAAAIATLSAAERKSLSSVLTPVIKQESLPEPNGPGQNWNLSQVLSLTRDGLSGRNFGNGRRTFAAARCIVCHRFDGRGGVTGPDLTDVIGRFSLNDLAEAIVDPSKVIPDQYRGSSVETADGMVITGRVVNNANGNLIVLTDPEDPNKVVQISSTRIDNITPLKTSLMPNDLLKPLGKEEVLDLLAYLMSRGNSADPVFQK